MHWLPNRDLARIAYAPSCSRSQVSSGSTARPDRRTEVSRRFAPRPLRSWASCGIPFVGALPISSRLRSVGAVGTRKAICTSVRRRGSLVTCLQEDRRATRSGVAAVAAARQVLRADEQETAGACLNYLRDRVFYPDDALARARPGDVYRRFDELAATAPAGSHRVSSHRGSTASAHRRRPHGARGMDEPVALDQPCRSRSSTLEGVALNSAVAARRGRTLRRPAVPMVERHRRWRGLRLVVPDPRRRAQPSDPPGRAPIARTPGAAIDRGIARAGSRSSTSVARAGDADLRRRSPEIGACTTSCTASSARSTSRTERCTGAQHVDFLGRGCEIGPEMRGCGEKLAQAQTRSRRVQQRLNASSLFEPKGAFGSAACGIVLAVATAAVYGIGSAGARLRLEPHSRCVREDRSLLDPLRRQIQLNNHPLFSLLEHVVWSLGFHTESDLRVLPIVSGALTVASSPRGARVVGDPSPACVPVRSLLRIRCSPICHAPFAATACSASGAVRVDPAPVAAGRVGAGARSSMGGIAYVVFVAAGISTHLYGCAVLIVHALIVVARRDHVAIVNSKADFGRAAVACTQARQPLCDRSAEPSCRGARGASTDSRPFPMSAPVSPSRSTTGDTIAPRRRSRTSRPAVRATR